MISFCTSYLGRHEHLEQTIPYNMDQARGFDCEFIFLDYSEYSDKWQNSKAKNKAHYKAEGDILVNVDADNYLTKEYIQGLIDKFRSDMNIIVYGEGANIGGRIAISKDNFCKLNGYDERFEDWGYEDIDFIYRAKNLGLKRIAVAGLPTIEHGDELRFKDEIQRKKNRPMMVYNRDNNVTDWRVLLKS